MTAFREGDRSRAICDRCGAVVDTTMRVRDVPFDDGAGIVPAILVAVCDRCDTVVAIPAQSTEAVAKAHREARHG